MRKVKGKKIPLAMCSNGPTLDSFRRKSRTGIGGFVQTSEATSKQRQALRRKEVSLLHSRPTERVHAVAGKHGYWGAANQLIE